MESFLFDELSEDAKLHAIAKYRSPFFVTHPLPTGENEIWFMYWRFDKHGDCLETEKATVCNHCGGQLVDGMCDAPLSNAD